MNILRSAWETLNHCVVVLVRAVIAPFRLIFSGYLAERARCRAIADLEALPRGVLRDIGVRRVEIPLVVSMTRRAQRDGAGVDKASSSAETENSPVNASVAQS